MSSLRLTEEELTQTIQRAREISGQSAVALEAAGETEQYIQIAEELGIPREAIELALRERQALPTQDFSAGEIVFAPSADGFWYPATITVAGAHTAQVRFIKGGEHSVALTDLRPLGLVPGRKIEANLKSWGWWGGTLDTYEPKNGKIVMDSWGEKNKTTLADIRLTPKIASPPTKLEQRQMALTQKALTRCALLSGSIGLAGGLALAQLWPWLMQLIR